MSFLERINVFKPRRRPVGSKLEIGDTDVLKRKRRNYIVKSLIISVVVAAALLVFPRNRLYQYTVALDDIWKQENLQAPFQFAIRKAAPDLEAERAQVKKDTPPIFVDRIRTDEVVERRADSISVRFNRVFDLYGQ